MPVPLQTAERLLPCEPGSLLARQRFSRTEVLTSRSNPVARLTLRSKSASSQLLTAPWIAAWPSLVAANFSPSDDEPADEAAASADGTDEPEACCSTPTTVPNSKSETIWFSVNEGSEVSAIRKG